MKDRRARVLQLVAEAYIDTAHPVASGQVAERLDVSSATVRNDFGTLESEGLLQQPHTSAGRIPTALGFRSYASCFLPPTPLSASQRRRLGLQLAGAAGDQFYALASRLASELSGYAVTVQLPPNDALRILEIHLAMLSSRRLLAVVVLENGVVRQLGVDLDPVPDDAVIDDAERNLRQLTLPVGEVPRALVAIAARAEEEMARTLLALASAWSDLQPPRTYSDGLSRLLSEPEGADPTFVRLVVAQVWRASWPPSRSEPRWVRSRWWVPPACGTPPRSPSRRSSGPRCPGPFRARIRPDREAAQACPRRPSGRLPNGISHNVSGPAELMLQTGTKQASSPRSRLCDDPGRPTLSSARL